MTPATWASLRSHPSQEKCFEALCAQLAEEENYPAGSRFERRGTPDAGLECLWRTPTGEHHGWQAKYFLNAMGASQWAQVDQSVRTAIETETSLTRLTVCVPHDLSAGKGKGKSERQKWDERVGHWMTLAAATSRKVDVRLWGNSELLRLLVQDRHAGLRKYYFGSEVLTRAKCKEFLDRQVVAAGPRYRPEINVDTPFLANLLRVFQPARFLNDWHEGLRGARKTADFYADKLDPATATQLRAQSEGFRNQLAELGAPTILPVLTKSWVASALQNTAFIRQESWDLGQRLESRVPTAVRHTAAPWNAPPDQQAANRVFQFATNTLALERLLKGSATQLACGQPLLVLGHAGIGKTHALLEAAVRHERIGGTVVVLFGGDIQGLSLLDSLNQGMDSTFSTISEFVGAMNAAGADSRLPAVLILDALNEASESPPIGSALRVLVDAVHPNPWVRLVVSHRTPFWDEDPYASLAEHFVRVEHHGFGEALPEAIVEYSRFHDITIEVPPLNPEFQNPLFLGLYAAVVAARPDRTFRPGSDSLLSLFEELLASTQRRLASQAVPGVDPRGRQVEQALGTIARELMTTRTSVIARDRAKSIVDAVAAPGGAAFVRSLFGQLIAERLLVERTAYAEATGRATPGIGVGWDRFTDLLIAMELLASITNVPALKEACNPGGTIVEYLTGVGHSRRAGVAVALAIIVAERLHVELQTFLPEKLTLSNSQILESVLWRSAEALPAQLAARVFTVALAQDGGREEVLDTVVQVALVEGHPLGIAHLHERLKSMPLDQRDRAWTAPLSRGYAHGALGDSIGLLLHQCWRRGNRKQPLAPEFSSEAALRALMLLSWCFTSPNRSLRDHATKAAVEVLSAHPQCAPALAAAFVDVDDPYVRERIAATCFGAATMQLDIKSLIPFAKSLPQLLETERSLPPSILLRHFVRKAASYISTRTKGAIQVPITTPSTPLAGQIASIRVLEKRFKSEHQCSSHSVWSSVTYGDFATYVMKLGLGNGRRIVPRRRSGIRPATVAAPQFVRRWVLNRIALLVPNMSEFDAFDAAVPHSGRMDHRIERMGKKYQWIAWRELLARLEDTFELAADGPWAPEGWMTKACVDIDPTVSIGEPGSDPLEQPSTCWWKPISYEPWDKQPSVADWLRDASDLPDTRDLLLARQPETGRLWVCLDGYYEWDEPHAAHLEKYDEPRRSLRLWCHPCLVRKKDMSTFLRRAQENSSSGEWRPHIQHAASALGDWPRAVQPSDDGAWDLPVPEPHWPQPPCPVQDMTRLFLAERGYDNSLVRTVSVRLVIANVLRDLDVEANTGDGVMRTADGSRISFDPSVFENGPGVALICADRLAAWLKRSGLGIVWSIWGEKLVIGEWDQSNYQGRLVIHGAYCFNPELKRIEGSQRTVFESVST